MGEAPTAPASPRAAARTLGVVSINRSDWAARDDEPSGQAAGITEERRSERSSTVAHGSLACPRCDAPVSTGGRLRPADPMTCPLCPHAGVVREFLSLDRPTRPAHVRIVAALPPVLARRLG